jgi:hypothetical protein
MKRINHTGTGKKRIGSHRNRKQKEIITLGQKRKEKDSTGTGKKRI